MKKLNEISYDPELLLSENQKAVAAIEGYLPKKKRVDIVLAAKFRDRDTALKARMYLKSLRADSSGDIQNAPVTISEVRDDPGYYYCEIGLFSFPNVPLITEAELLLRNACEKFGGTQPGWDVVLPGIGRVKTH